MLVVRGYRGGSRRMGYREWGTENGVEGVGAREWRAKRPHQKRVLSLQKIRTNRATKVLQGPWFAQSLSHNLIRAKEIAKVAFERHSMVRS